MDLSHLLVIHSAGNLGEPVVQSSDETDNTCSDHYVVKVRYDEVCSSESVIQRNRSEKDPCNPTDDEICYRPQSEERRGLEAELGESKSFDERDHYDIER